MTKEEKALLKKVLRIAADYKKANSRNNDIYIVLRDLLWDIEALGK